MKKTKRHIERDASILANYKREINLQTRFVRDNSKYTRKVKHKQKLF